MQHLQRRCLYKLHQEYGYVLVPSILQVGLSDEEKAALDAISLSELDAYKPVSDSKQQVSRVSICTNGPGTVRANGNKKRLQIDICTLRTALHKAL